MPELQDGQFYTGTVTTWAVVELGKSATKAMQFTLRMPDETEHQTTCWLGSKRGKDGKSNNDRIQESLVKLGCDMTELCCTTWADHIQSVIVGKQAAAKAEEYNGRVNLKGIYSPGGGGGKPVALNASPFSAGGSDDLGVSDDDLPF